ncbi:Oidioi.mRNA.OKI2018_I69.XSR.g14714.t1.cds [Oikopleura dioica]|uniref:Oidioi.mRNA.OKI2018_I69.XSR.g14714.t1.cds n=1 Tax=Oikopleura dioica TaxID=34765 RepID=A0ABN7SFL5_OIKDI|nr:Oidioi.mRNA.OKI2018_I69.XSR.g14714.t1.cds [Oikopleura dioica]
MSGRRSGQLKSHGKGRTLRTPSHATPKNELITSFLRQRPPRITQPNRMSDESSTDASTNPAAEERVPQPKRTCPLPNITWAEREHVWAELIKREKRHRLDMKVLSHHPEVTPRMRSVLIDWLMEVSEVYRLHRETVYNAVTYVDRYLARQTHPVRKNELQLIGVSALFFSAKLEEIYPPKLVDFAYVTDSACTEVEMREMELIMLKKLQWELSTPTAISWLNLYLQVAQLPMNNDHFHLPQYPQETFVQIAQLIDLCLLDIQSLKFLPSQLAAACLYHFSLGSIILQIIIYSEDIALDCSGYKMEEIAAAIKWVTPFAETIRDEGLAALKSFRKVKVEDAHNIQTHINNVTVLEKAQALQTSRFSQLSTTSSSRWSATPETPTDLNILVTPQSEESSKENPSNPASTRSRKRPSVEPVAAHIDPKRLASESGAFPATPDTSPLALSHSSSLSTSPNAGQSGSASGSTSEIAPEDIEDDEDDVPERVPFAPLKYEEESQDSTGSSLSATDLAEEIDLPLEDESADVQPIS